MVGMSVEPAKHGRQAKQTKRDCPLKFSGVGKGAESCTFIVTVPAAFERLDGHTRAGDGQESNGRRGRRGRRQRVAHGAAHYVDASCSLRATSRRGRRLAIQL